MLLKLRIEGQEDEMQGVGQEHEPIPGMGMICVAMELEKRSAAGGVIGEPKRFLFYVVKRY